MKKYNRSRFRSLQHINKGFLNSTYRHNCGMGAAAGCISGLGAINIDSVDDGFTCDASGCGGCGGCGG